ncbi:hypothetical protein FE257_002308 [Aspergillus nanangensis]|uniref:Uncharacterized protein n=1 Tax=Aspergillus nanangensis TaxID=2582783 RepID=A0AAD4CD47_ASPNN|nr:hypothetical protein FE257_002308 [Aspergillus nanangensis]
MSRPFSYLFYQDDNLARDPMDVTAATTATLTDGSSTYDVIDTPSTTDNNTLAISRPADKCFQGTPASSVALPEPARALSAPEPTILLYQIQQVAEDVSQLVGRFGYKMARTVGTSNIKNALFADQKLLRLPCLKYADNFTCRVTKRFAKHPTDYTNSAPLLWWLWDELLDYLTPSYSTHGCKLEFTPARETDIALPYTISINLAYKHGNNNIELTASYGGLFHEQRIFDAAIAEFRLPETTKYGKSIMAPLNIDRYTHKEKGCLAHTLDYLVPRSGSLWRLAMKAFSLDEEETLVVALVGTCKAEDDHCYMSTNQGQQCLNLLQRLPPEAREYIIKEKLVGQRNGPYSKMANQPPGPKD